MNYLLFAVYFLLLSWLLHRIPFLKNSGISKQALLGLFMLKIAAGILLGWTALHFYGNGNDYWDLNRESWNEYQLMFNDPGRYLTNLFTSDYEGGYGGVFSSHDSYWNDLRGNIIIKLLSVFNIFSRGDYYINSLFFNSLIFFGHVMLYRLFIQLYPGKDILVITGCFLLPSLLYFSSGIHKDGMVFLMMSIFIYAIFQSLIKGRVTVKRSLLIVFSIIMLFMLRNYVCMALLPATIGWVTATRLRWKPWLSFLMIYLALGILVVALASVGEGKMNLLSVIVKKQSDYLKLGPSETSIALSELKPGTVSFVVNAPQAINHSLLRPYIWESANISLLPFSVELLLYQLLFLAFLVFRRKDISGPSQPFVFFSIVFVFTIFLLIGYIVPNLGSILRYRSLYFSLLITPLLCLVDWQKLKTLKII